MIRIFQILIFFIILTVNLYGNTNEKVFKKIDLFGEVLEKIKKEYVEDVDQSEMLTLQLMVHSISRSLFRLYEP